MPRLFTPFLMAIGGLSLLLACRPASQLSSSTAPAEGERKQMKGLGKNGWAAEALVDLLKEGETQESWQSQTQAPVTPIVVDLDAYGMISLNDQFYKPEQLREWLVNTVATFGPHDPLILRPKPETPLPALERAAAIAFDSGLTNIFVLADSQLEGAYAVRLNGKAMRIIPNVGIPPGQTDSSRER